MKSFRLLFLSLMLFGVLAACATVAPALRNLAVAIGQDLIAAASFNHSPRYALQLEELLVALTRHTTGMEVQGQLASLGYQPPPPRWAQQNQNAGGSYAQNQTVYESGAPADDATAYADTYGDSGYEAGAYDQPAYDQSAYDQSAYDTTSYDQSAYDASVYEQSTYDSGGYDAGAYDSTDATAYDDTYAAAEPSANGSVYRSGTGTATLATRGAAPIALQTALLARRAGTAAMVEINEGDTLFDGGADPAAGDLLKFHFRANCACYLYVIGIDATGYVASIFPDPEENHANPVTPEQDYLLPAGDNWWGLDQQKGVEQVIFLASRQPREDVEALLTQLARKPRQVPDQYQPVTQLAIPSTRGLVKVSARPVNLEAGGSTQAVRPAVFTTKDTRDELMVDRWFYHR